MTIFFFALPIAAAAYIGPRECWFGRTQGYVLASVFTIAWVTLAGTGGWVLTTGTTKRSGSTSARESCLNHHSESKASIASHGG